MNPRDKKPDDRTTPDQGDIISSFDTGIDDNDILQHTINSMWIDTE